MEVARMSSGSMMGSKVSRRSIRSLRMTSRRSMFDSRKSTSMGFNDYAPRGRASTSNIRRLSTNSASGVQGRSPGQMRAAKLLHQTAFEFLMGFVIVSNVLVMIIEIDGTAYEDEAFSRRLIWTEVFGWAVLLVFTMELLLRLYAFRSNFWMDAWNVFDFGIVGTDIIVFLITVTLGKVFPVTWLRVFRLAKLARLAKVLRIFPELRLLLSSLLSAMSAILWGAFLLGLVLLAWAMAAVLFIHPLNKEIHYEGCERCPRAYGSVMNALLTFWQGVCAGDSWGKVTIPLIEKHPATACFFIPLFLSVGMAIVSLILGMVVSVAQQARYDIKEVDNAAATAAKFEKQSKLLQLCKQMDTDCSGEVSQEELLVAFDQPGEFRDSMELLGITRDDFDVVWAILDKENCGSVCYKRLVSRLYSMKTADSQFTLAYLKYHITLIKDILAQIENYHEHQVAEEEKIEGELKEVEQENKIIIEGQEKLLEQVREAVRAVWQGEQKWEPNHTTATAKQVQGAGCQADKEESDDGFSSNEETCIAQISQKSEVRISEAARRSEASSNKEGCTAQDAKSEAARGEAPQTREAADAYLEVAKGKEPPKMISSITPEGHAKPNNWHEAPGETFNGLQEGLRETASNLIDESQFLLQKISRDIDRLRLEFKDMLRNELRDTLKDLNPEPVLGPPPPSAMECQPARTEAHLDLLVVPEQTSVCRLFPGCNHWPAEIRARDEN